jgi:putative endonuclease
MREHAYYVYIMSSLSRTLYVGFTSDLGVRVRQHQAGTYEGFTTTYRCRRLVWYQSFEWVGKAIAREKQIKRWSRGKKIELIERVNPAWADLSAGWGEVIEYGGGI